MPTQRSGEPRLGLSGRIAATFQAKGRGRSLVGVEHTRVKSAERAAEWKGDRRTWLGDLKKLLEGRPAEEPGARPR